MASILRAVGFAGAWLVIVVVVVDQAAAFGRRRRSVAAAALLPDDILAAGQQLESVDGRHALRMQRDGNLVLRRHGRAVWSSGTATPGSLLAVEPGGEVVITGPHGEEIWAIGTDGIGRVALELHDDGTLRLVDGRHRTLWRADTTPIRRPVLLTKASTAPRTPIDALPAPPGPPPVAPARPRKRPVLLTRGTATTPAIRRRRPILLSRTAPSTPATPTTSPATPATPAASTTPAEPGPPDAARRPHPLLLDLTAPAALVTITAAAATATAGSAGGRRRPVLQAPGRGQAQGSRPGPRTRRR